MRPIDADRLLEKVEKIQPWEPYLGKYAQGIRHCMEIVSLLIKDAPTIESSAQPEIIRCKDCKYWNPYYAECEGIGNWFGFEGAWSENGYCYKAERREE